MSIYFFIMSIKIDKRILIDYAQLTEFIRINYQHDQKLIL